MNESLRRNPPRWRLPARYIQWTALALLVALPLAAFAQTSLSGAGKLTDEMRTKLNRPGKLVLRDATIVELLFVIRKEWGVNIVIPNQTLVKGETINCEFVETPLYEVLDSILISRNLGYQLRGNTLAIVALESMGPIKPLFETALIKVENLNMAEAQDAASIYLSHFGELKPIVSAKKLIIIDYPDRIEQVKQRIGELEQDAKDLADAAKKTVDDAAKKEAEERVAAAKAAQGNPAAPAGAPSTTQLPAPLPALKTIYVKLDFVPPKLIAPAIQSMLSKGGTMAVVDLENRLIITDYEDNMERLEEAINRLDVPRRQVRIAAQIYDVSLDDLRTCGVNWRSLGAGNLPATATGTTSAATTALGAADTVALNALGGAAPVSAAANSTMTFLTTSSSNFNLSAVINALAESRQSRLLADPNIVCYNMEPSSINIVKQIPFQQLTQGLGGGSIGTTSFKNVGVTLNVTPMIAGDQSVAMSINSSFDILAGTSASGLPIIDSRQAQGKIRIRSGETTVIGGMRQRTSVLDITGVPYLMNLRFGIGNLFKFKNASVRESELVIFLTPEILPDDYLGRPREHSIHGAVNPSLDQIDQPQLPLDPCPPLEWPRRCAGTCQKCHRRHCKHQCNGQCADAREEAMQAGELPLPSHPYPAQTAPAPSQPIQESPPVASPVIEPATQRLPSPPKEPVPAVDPLRTARQPVKITPPAAVAPRPAPARSAARTPANPVEANPAFVQRTAVKPVQVRPASSPPATPAASNQTIVRTSPLIQVAAPAGELGPDDILPLPASAPEIAAPEIVSRPAQRPAGPKRLTPIVPIQAARVPNGAMVR